MGPRVRIEGAACLLGAVFLFLIPLKWFLAAVLAGAFHELCHLFAIWATGGEVGSITIGTGGTVMETAPMSGGRESLCALAGPMGSFLLLGFLHSFPELALCGLVQGLFNLLPLYPLDGGRAVGCVLRLFSLERAGKYLELATLLFLVLGGIFAGICLNLGMIPLVLVGIAGSRALLRKIPCKDGNLAVQ